MFKTNHLIALIVVITASCNYTKPIAETPFYTSSNCYAEEDVVNRVYVDSSNALILVGCYSYPRHGWYSGISLQINKDMSFVEDYWNCTPSKSLNITGKVLFEDGNVQFVYGKKADGIYCYQLSASETDTFLVPVNKTEVFNYKYPEFNKFRDTSVAENQQSERFLGNHMNQVAFVKSIRGE